jgi:hypothetical protein
MDKLDYPGSCVAFFGCVWSAILCFDANIRCPRLTVVPRSEKWYDVLAATRVIIVKPEKSTGKCSLLRRELCVSSQPTSTTLLSG